MHAPSWLLLVAVAACGGPDRSGRAPDHKCDDAPPETRAEWRHRVRATLAGSPRHVVSDPIVRAGSDADVTVKLAYGKLNKDLEDEAVSIWVRRALPKAVVRIEFVDRQPPIFWNELQPAEYGFLSNVNPNIPHPRWTQASERFMPSEGVEERIPTQIFNGYDEWVGDLYPDEPRTPSRPIAR